MNQGIGNLNLDCFYLKIILNMVSTIGFTKKLNALNFEENDHTLLIKTNAHIEIHRSLLLTRINILSKKP